MEHIDYAKLAGQVAALADSMDGVSEVGRAFLYGVETALHVVTDAEK